MTYCVNFHVGTFASASTILTILGSVRTCADLYQQQAPGRRWEEEKRGRRTKTRKRKVAGDLLLERRVKIKCSEGRVRNDPTGLGLMSGRYEGGVRAVYSTRVRESRGVGSWS